MNDGLVMQRLNAIHWCWVTNHYIPRVDQQWLKNWLGKDGKPEQLLDEAVKEKQLQLITERLTGGNSKTIQTPNFLA